MGLFGVCSSGAPNAIHAGGLNGGRGGSPFSFHKQSGLWRRGKCCFYHIIQYVKAETLR